METLKTSLITTLYNEAGNIRTFLQSYKEQTRYAEEFIILDGGSDDGTPDIITQFSQENPQLNIRVIVDKSCSKKHTYGAIAKGRNVAITESRHPYIAVTDAGCVLDRHWFEEIIKPFENSSVDVVAGWFEAKADTPFETCYINTTMPTLQSIDPEVFLPSSRSIAFKKSCWRKAGYYPESTYTAEDTMFDLQMKKEGCRFLFAPKALVYWECPKILSEAISKHYHYAYGDGQLRIDLLKNLLRMPLLPLTLLRHRLRLKDKEAYRLKRALVLAHSRGYFHGLIKGSKR